MTLEETLEKLRGLQQGDIATEDPVGAPEEEDELRFFLTDEDKLAYRDKAGLTKLVQTMQFKRLLLTNQRLQRMEHCLLME